MIKVYRAYHKKEIINIENASKNTTYTCVYCNGILIPKQGTIMRHHFAHKTAGECTLTNDKNPLLSKRSSFWAKSPIEYLNKFNSDLVAKEAELTNQVQAVSQVQTEFKNALKLLRDISKPYKNGKMPKNRMDNKAVLDQLKKFIKDPDKCERPDFTKVSHSSFEYYYTNDQRIKSYNAWMYEHAIPDGLYEANKGLALYNLDPNTDLHTFQNHKKDLDQITLYFLEIELPEGNHIYKIGITRRDIQDRLIEIKYDLKDLEPKSIEVLYKIKGMSPLEKYYLKRYKKAQYKIGNHQEYFKFYPEVINHIKEELRKLSYLDIDRVQAIKQGMKGNLGGRPKEKESVIKFFNKPKTKLIIEHLEKGKGVREISRDLSVSVNTIRKTKSLIEEV